MGTVARLVVGAKWRWDGTLGYFLGLSLSAVAGPALAQGIVADGRTQTTVSSSGSVTSVTTTTTSGGNAFNSFQRFSVEAGRTANLYLPSGTANLINIVRDRTDVFGVLNSIKDNAVGGNVWFASPNGFLVGAGGVVNVGSLTVSTPTVAFVDGFFLSPGTPNPGSVTQLLGGTAPRNANASIRIDGTINAIEGVTLRAGQVSVGGMVYSGARFTGSAPDFHDVVNANGLEAANNVVASDGRIMIVADRSVTVSGTLAAPGGPAGVHAGDISVTAARSDGGSARIDLQNATLVAKGIALSASSERNADLSPLRDTAALAGLETIDAGASVVVDSSALTATGGRIDVAATSAVTVSATGGLPVAVLRGSSTATVDIKGSSSLTTSAGNARLSATSTVTSTATPTSPLANLAGDAMVATSDFPSTATVRIGDTAKASIGGALELAATNTVQTTQVANASAAGGSGAGAALALSLIDSQTSATVEGQAQILSADSLTLSAQSSSRATVTAKSAAKGAGEDTSGTGKASQTLTKYQDDTKTGDSGNSGSGVKVAAAVAVSDLKSTTRVSLASGQQANVAGAVTLTSQASNSVDVDADGSATSGAVGVGVAVALNLAKSSSQALVTQDLKAQSLDVGATMPQPDAVDRYTTSAQSGAGASSVGVAGSLAVNALDHETTAALRSGANVTILPGGTGATRLDASQSVTSSASAKPSADGASGEKVGIGASVAVHVVSNRSVAELGDAATLSGAGDITLHASGDSDVTTHSEAGSKGGVSITPSAAISLVNNTTSARIGSGSAPLTLAGDLDLRATQVSRVDTSAEGSSEGEKAAIGAAVAVALVDDRVGVDTARELVATGSAGAGKGLVDFHASGASSSQVSSKASAAGGKSDDEAGSQDSTTGQPAEDATVDQKVNKQLGAGASVKKKNAVGDTAEQDAADGATKDDKASASTSEGKISVAAAVAVNRQNSTVTAKVPDSGRLDAAGRLTVAASNNTDGSALADGSAVKSTTTLGIGAGVAVNLVKAGNEASIGQGAKVQAKGLTLQAQMTDVKGDGSDLGHTLSAEAKSGAGGSKVGLAGSLALNLADTESQALLKSGAEVDLRGGKLMMTADDRSDTTGKALPAEAGGASGGKVGIGASVAVNIVAHRAVAEVEDTAKLRQPGNLELAASGDFSTHTEAEAGASGGVAITPVVALAILNNSTRARLGAGDALDGAGTVTLTADHKSSTTTSAKGSAEGEKAAIGAAVGVLLLDDVAGASVERNLTHGTGALTITTTAQSASSNSASASSKGGKSDDEAGQTDSSTGKKKEDATVDDKVGGQLDYGKKRQSSAGVGDADQKSATSDGAAKQPSAASDEGKVSVAAAVAVNIVDASASARIGHDVEVDTSGAVVLHASGNTDASASADAAAVGKTAQVGIGAAVSVNKVSTRNEASIGNDARVAAQGVELQAGMTDVAGERRHTVAAEAKSGAGGSKVGIAGSLALNLADTESQALLKSGAQVDLLGGKLTMTADDRSDASAKALPAEDGGASGGKVGIGASVALNIVAHRAVAEVEDTAKLRQPGNLELAASGDFSTHTEAEAGASGGVAITPVLALAILNNTTRARLGGGDTLDGAGTVTLSADHKSSTTTSAKGSTQGEKAAIGAAVGVLLLDDVADASIDRNISNGTGALTITTTAQSASSNSASASSKGGKSDDEAGQTDSTTGKKKEDATVDDKVGGKLDYGKKRQASAGVGDAKQQAATDDGVTKQPSAASDEGKVSVAAAVAVNIVDASASARIGHDVSVDTNGAVVLHASGNTDASASADAAAVGKTAQVGIGAAVSVNKVSTRNEASIGNDARVAAQGVELQAGMTDVSGERVNTLQAQSQSGAGGSKVGIAASLALNLADTSSQALVQGGAAIDARGGAVALRADDRSSVSAKAEPTTSGGADGGKVGVGASVALNLVDAASQAQVASGAGIANADSLTMAATLLGDSAATATAGATGGKLAFDAAVAVTTLNQRTEASVAAGSAIDVTGLVDIGASSSGTHTAQTKGVAKAGSVAIGASVGVIDGESATAATVDRDLSAGTTFTLTAGSNRSYDAQSTASAGGSQSDDTYSSNKSQADSASSSKALQKNQDAETNQGTKDGGKINVAAAVGVASIDDDVEASVRGGRTIASGAGQALTVSATNTSNFRVRGAGDAVDPNAKVGVGVGVGIAINKNDTTATLADSTHVTQSGDLSVLATSSQNTDPAFATKLTAEGLAGAGGSKVGVAGALAVAYSKGSTRASVGAGTHIDDSGQVRVRAENTAALSAKAWAGAFGQVGVGASVATVISDNAYVATVGGAGTKVKAAGLEVGARNNRVSPTPFSLDLSGLGDMSSADSAKNELTDIANQFTSGQLLGGGNYYTEAAAGAAGDKVAVAGSFAVNVFKDHTDASIAAGSEVDTGSGQVQVRAVNDTVARSLAGSLSAGGRVGVGVSSADVASTNVTRSHIDAGTQVTHSGGITLEAKNNQDVLVIGVAGGVAGNVAVSGVANVITLDNRVEALVAASPATSLTTSGDFSATASQDVKGVNVATGLALSGSVAVGLVGAVNTLGTDASHQFVTHAGIGDGASVNAARRTALEATVSTDLSTFAIAGAASGSVSAGGAAVANVMNSDTRADIGAGAKVNEGQALTEQSASLLAQDSSGIFSVVAGAAASGSVGIGASGDIGLITKSTQASIGQGAHLYMAGDLRLQASADEDFRSVAIGLGVGGSAGAAGSVSAYLFTGHTLAFVDDAAQVRVRGSALVAADDSSTMNLIAGSVSAGGAGAIGAAAGVSVFDKTTQAWIGNADIEALGNDADGIDAATGEMAVTFGGAIAENGRVKNTTLAPEDAQGNTIAAGTGGGIGDRKAFQALLKTRTATPVETTMHGLAITATNRDTFSSFAVTGAAGGGLAVTLGGNIAVVTTDTQASIDAGARINQTGTAGGAAQSVRVAAGSDQFHLGLAGAASGSGGVAAGAGADVMVAHNTVAATIGADAQVKAERDVEVTARGQGQYLEMGAGLAAAGSLAIAGSVGVLSVSDTTVATIAGGAGTTTTVEAGGNVRVRARDDTETNMIAGAAAAGFGTAGFGVAVGVTPITKDTEARIGDGVTVQSLGGHGAAAFDATLPDAVSDSSTTSMRGLQVEARSKEDLFTVSASGAGGLYAGISGAVTVTVVDSTTQATIGNAALINTRNTGAALDQDVNVSAHNELKSQAFTGSIAVGAAGISGGVDVLTARNNTHAGIGAGAEVHAARDVAVNASSSADLSTTVVSAAAGLVAGVAGGVSLYSVGDKLGTDAQGQLTANGDVKGQADREARGSALADLLSSSSDARVRDISAQAQGKRGAVSTAAATGGVPSAGNSASIGSNAHIFSGGDTIVDSRGSLAYQSTTGAAAVGALGLGAGIGIANFRIDNQATIGASAEITAQGDLRVHASLHQADQGVRGLAFAGTGGIIAVNAAWASMTDGSNTTASLGSGVRVWQADDVVVEAVDRRNLEAQAMGASIGAIAAGASVAGATVTGTTSATIGADAFVGTSSQDVGSLTVQADSRVKATSATVAAAGGIGVLAASGSAADAIAKPVVTASLDGGIFHVAGQASVLATGSAGASADALGYSVSAGLGIGASLASAHSLPTVSASLGDGTRLYADQLRVAAQHLLPDHLFAFDSTLSRSQVTGTAVRAQANATSGGLLLGATGSDAEAEFGSAQRRASVTAHVGDGSRLEVNGSLEVSAAQDSSQNARASGLAFGLAAVGSNDARAHSYTSTHADLGTDVGVTGNATLGSAEITAQGTDRNIASAVSGSGGVVAGAAAHADTLSVSDTQAFIGDLARSSAAATISTGRVAVDAQHETVYNAKVDSTQASVAGASGASNSHWVDSNVASGVGRGVEVTASDIALDAENTTRKPWWGRSDDNNSVAAADGAEWNVDSGSGGLLNLPAGRTVTTILQRTAVSTGEDSLLHVTLPAAGNGALNLSAVNTVVSYDKSKLDSGGAIALAESNSMINAGIVKNGDLVLQVVPISATVTVGRGSTLTSDSGDIDIGSANNVKLDARAVANAYGLAGAPSGKAYVTYVGSNRTNVEADALLLATDPEHGRINVGAGQGSQIVADSHVNLWNKTVVPINSTPDAQTIVTQDATVNLAAGSLVLAGGDIGLAADRGAIRTSAVGIGKDLYREALAAIAGAFGIDASLDIKGGYAPAPAGQALVNVDGTVLSGLLRQSATQIDVDILSPWTIDQQTGAVSITWGLKVSQVDSRDHPGGLAADPLGLDRANPFIGWVTPKETDVAPNSQLQARLTRLYELRSQYQSDPVASAAYASEIAFLEKKLISQGVGQRSSTVSAQGTAAINAGLDATAALDTEQVKITGDIRGSTAAAQIGAVGTLVAEYGAAKSANSSIDTTLKALKNAKPTSDTDYAALNTALDNAAAAYNGKNADLLKATGDSNLVAAIDRIGNYSLNKFCDSGASCTVVGPLGALGTLSAPDPDTGARTLSIAGKGYLGALQQSVNDISLLALRREGATGTLVSDVENISAQMGNIKNANTTIQQSAADVRQNLNTAAGKQALLRDNWRDKADPKDNVDTTRVATITSLIGANAPRIADFDAAGSGTSAKVIAGAAAAVSDAATRAATAVGTVSAASNTTTPGSEKLLSFDDISVKLGNVNVKADRLTGSGSVQAPGDGKIWILNNAPASMNIGSLGIDASGGNVRLNGFLVNSETDLRSFDPSYTGAVPDLVTRENARAGLPEILVVSTYDPGAYCCKPNPDGVTRPSPPAPGTPAARQVPAAAPDITLGYRIKADEPRPIYNPFGSVTVTSLAGDIYVDSPITAGSVSVQAMNGDFVQQYVNGFSSVAGDPNHNAQGGSGVLNPVNPVGNGIVANGNIFISARYLNINGLVQSGIVNYHLDIPDDASLRFVLPSSSWTDAWKTAMAGCQTATCTLLSQNGQLVTFEKNWRGVGSTSTGRVVANKAFVDQWGQVADVAVTTSGALDYGAIAATYDPATQQITMTTSAQVRGGSIVLFGQIINTADAQSGSPGKLAVLDGFGQIEVNNQSSLPVVLKSLDTGVDPNAKDRGRGIAGTIDITDVQYVGAAGDQNLYAIKTLITRENDAIKVKQTGAWNGADFDPNVVLTSFASNDPNSPARVNVTDGRHGAYDPQAGLRYVFTTGTTTSTEYTWVFKGQSFFGTSSLSLPPSQTSMTQSGPPRVLSNYDLKDGTYLSYKAPDGTTAHKNNLSADAAMSNKSSSVGVAQSSDTRQTSSVYNKIDEWNDCDWWSLCISSKYTSIWSQTVGRTTITTNSVKADYPIQVEFLGANSPTLSVQSPNAAVSLAAGEQLSNRYGDTSLAVKALGAATGSLIETKNLTVNANGGSIGAVGAPVNVLLSGALTANAPQGNVVVRQIAGPLEVAGVSAAGDATGGVGKVVLSAQDSIFGRTANSLISGARIELESSTGSIGGIAGSSRNAAGTPPLRVAPGYTADRSRQADYGLKATAAGDIGIDVVATASTGNNPGGHLLVDQVVSAGGDVRLSAPGQILDNNPIFSIDTRSYAELLAYADTIGLRANAGTNAQKLARALDAMENTRTQAFNQYWQMRDVHGAPAAFDASWRYQATAAERKALNNDTAAIKSFEDERTAQYWRLADTVTGFDADALARGQEAARLLAAARAQDVARIKAQHPTWTPAQVEAQAQIEAAADTTRISRIRAQVLAEDAAGTLKPASAGTRIDGFVYIASADERAAQEQGSTWTNAQLALSVNPGLLKDLTDTNPVIKAPNVSGRHVELIAGTSLGTTLPASDPDAVVIPLDTDGNLTPAQKVALATAEFSDFSFSDPARRTGTVTISQRLPVNFSASQSLSASVREGGAASADLTPHTAGTDRGNAYLTSLGGVKVDRIDADGEVRLKVKGDISALDPSAPAIHAGDLILEAANGNIGGDAAALTPLRVEVARGVNAAADSHGSLTARGVGRINLVESGDMAIGGIFSRDAVIVTSETGSIVNARPGENSGLVLLGGTLQISAPRGSIGDVVAGQALAVGTNIGTPLRGVIQADAGQWIDLKGPASLLVPSLFAIGPVVDGADALHAGIGIQLLAEGDATINGRVVTPGDLNLVAGGQLTLSTARDIPVGNPNSAAGVQTVTLPAAQFVASGDAFVNADTLWMDDGATLNTAGRLQILTQHDAVVTGITSTNPTVDAVRITSLAGRILAGHELGSGHLDITADTAPNATLTMTAARGIGDELLNLKLLNLNATSGGVVDLAVQGPVTIGSVLAADRVLLTADGSITGGSVVSSGTGSHSDQTVTLRSSTGSVELSSVGGRSDVAVSGPQGVTLGSVSSQQGDAALRSANGGVTVGRAQAGDRLEVDAFGDVRIGQATSGGLTALSSSTGTVHVEQIAAGALQAGTPGAIELGSADVQSDLRLAASTVTAAVQGGAQPVTGAVTGFGNTLADRVDLTLSGAGGFQLGNLWADWASVNVPVGALSIDEVRIADQALFRNPRTRLLVDQDHLNVSPADVELYSAGAPFYLRLEGNQIGTNAFVIRRSPLHEVTGPDGPVRSAAEVTMDTLARATLEPPPAMGPPRVVQAGAPLRFSGVPVSTKGVCAPELNQDCPR